MIKGGCKKAGFILPKRKGSTDWSGMSWLRLYVVRTSNAALLIPIGLCEYKRKIREINRE